ncbi:hypothetical protein [Aurantimonas coralicida]|mgnify:CR=1 FL=1|uniref:hypothetical protein n=1 Tax=Aurantimonas coralicida TaxID=182270 RepID=UPI00238F13F3|nr:hypothetical protein [Aurantimonas coralicida]MDE0925120.1 hypothetical protein [Aurantimonas coralicida]
MACATDYYDDLETRLNGIIATLEGIFTSMEVREVAEFIGNREYGIGVETIVDIALEENKALPQSVIDELRDICRTMDVAVPDGFDEIDVRSPRPLGPLG